LESFFCNAKEDYLVGGWQVSGWKFLQDLRLKNEGMMILLTNYLI
jgi:hypothetical protein